MPNIQKVRRREIRRNKGQRHRVHAGFEAQYQAMYNRELERREDLARRDAVEAKYAVGESSAR